MKTITLLVASVSLLAFFGTGTARAVQRCTPTAQQTIFTPDTASPSQVWTSYKISCPIFVDLVNANFTNCGSITGDVQGEAINDDCYLGLADPDTGDGVATVISAVFNCRDNQLSHRQHISIAGQNWKERDASTGVWEGPYTHYFSPLNGPNYWRRCGLS